MQSRSHFEGKFSKCDMFLRMSEKISTKKSSSDFICSFMYIYIYIYIYVCVCFSSNIYISYYSSFISLTKIDLISLEPHLWRWGHTSSCTLLLSGSGSRCPDSLRTRTEHKRWPVCRSTSEWRSLYRSPDSDWVNTGDPEELILTETDKTINHKSIIYNIVNRF